MKPNQSLDTSIDELRALYKAANVFKHSFIAQDGLKFELLKKQAGKAHSATKDLGWAFRSFCIRNDRCTNELAVSICTLQSEISKEAMNTARCKSRSSFEHRLVGLKEDSDRLLADIHKLANTLK
ncbi:hypothetical protein [Vibrio campbellii]|uniref:hypothetical protein n=1 Tax=Vibrio campbellii TaxID=680 RepID=UPI0037DD00AC